MKALKCITFSRKILLGSSVLLLPMLPLASPRACAGSLSGVVLEFEGDQTVEGAEVTLYPGTLMCTTDSLGRFSIQEIEPGMYLIRIEADGFLTAEADNLIITDYAESLINVGFTGNRSRRTPTELMNGRIIGCDSDGHVYVYSPVSTSIEVQCIGDIHEATVRQNFLNESTASIDAAFIYPVPYYCFCNSFTARIGKREICGRFLPRDIAESEYQSALADGRESPLHLTDHPYSFNRLLGELAPGESLQIEFSYLGPVAREEEWFNITFPIVRETSGEWADESVSHGTPLLMVPGEDIDISVSITSPLPVRLTETIFAEDSIEERYHRPVLLPGTSEVPMTEYLQRFSIDGSTTHGGILADKEYFLLGLVLNLLPMDDSASSVHGSGMSNLNIALRDSEVSELVPRDVHEMLSGEPVFVFGRYAGTLPSEVELSGTVAGRDTVIIIPLSAEFLSDDIDLLQSAWAFRYCEIAGEEGIGDEVVTDVALEHSLATPFTTMFLFDNQSGDCVSRFPEGVRYDQINAGLLAPLYLGIQSRSVITLQPSGRGVWGYRTIHR